MNCPNPNCGMPMDDVTKCTEGEFGKLSMFTTNGPPQYDGASLYEETLEYWRCESCGERIYRGEQ